MNRVLVVFAIVNWIAALVIGPSIGLSNGALKLQVMSRYHELCANGVINEDQLAKVGWERLRGSGLQKAQEYFLEGATGFYTRTGWGTSALLAANGAVLLLANRIVRRTSRPAESATSALSRPDM